MCLGYKLWRGAWLSAYNFLSTCFVFINHVGLQLDNVLNIAHTFCKYGSFFFYQNYWTVMPKLLWPCLQRLVCTKRFYHSIFRGLFHVWRWCIWYWPSQAIRGLSGFLAARVHKTYVKSSHDVVQGSNIESASQQALWIPHWRRQRAGRGWERKVLLDGCLALRSSAKMV